MLTVIFWYNFQIGNFADPDILHHRRTNGRNKHIDEKCARDKFYNKAGTDKGTYFILLAGLSRGGLAKLL